MKYFAAASLLLLALGASAAPAPDAAADAAAAAAALANPAAEACGVNICGNHVRIRDANCDRDCQDGPCALYACPDGHRVSLLPSVSRSLTIPSSSTFPYPSPSETAAEPTID